MLHPHANLLDQGQDNESGNSVRYKSRDDKDQRRKYDQDPVEAVVCHPLCDGTRNGVQQTRRADRFSKTEAAGCENDNGPEKVVEVLLRQDTGSEEEDERNDRDDAHVTKCVLELVAHAPENDGNYRNNADEPLDSRKLVSD